MRISAFSRDGIEPSTKLRVGSGSHRATSGKRWPLRPDFSKLRYAHIEYIWYPREASMPIAGIYGPDDFENKVHSHPTVQALGRVSPPDRARALPMPSLQWTPEVERGTAHLYERVKNVISPVEWPLMAPYIKAINELKQTREA